jgi:hypothetical protein
MGNAGLIPEDFEPGYIGVKVEGDRLRAFDRWMAAGMPLEGLGPPKDPDKDPPDPGQSPDLPPDILPVIPEDFPNWEDKPEEEE